MRRSKSNGRALMRLRLLPLRLCSAVIPSSRPDASDGIHQTWCDLYGVESLAQDGPVSPRNHGGQPHTYSRGGFWPQTAQRRVKRVQARDSVQRKQHCERGSEHQTVREAQCERDLIKLTSSLDLSRQNRPHSSQPCSVL